MMGLPDFKIKTQVIVGSNNLDALKVKANLILGRDYRLETDDDFLSAKGGVAELKQGITSLQDAKKAVLASCSDVNIIISDLTEIEQDFRSKAKYMQGAVKGEEARRKLDIIEPYEARGRGYVERYIARVEKSLPKKMKGQVILSVGVDFKSAGRHKRKLSSVEAACKEMLADVIYHVDKLPHDENAVLFAKVSDMYLHLFYDASQLLGMDDLDSEIKRRCKLFDNQLKKGREIIKRVAAETAEAAERGQRAGCLYPDLVGAMHDLQMCLNTYELASRAAKEAVLDAISDFKAECMPF